MSGQRLYSDFDHSSNVRHPTCDMTTRVSMSSRSRRSTPSNERHEPRPSAEEWQLRILWELHKEQPRPTVEQRRLLATQTGL